MASWQINTFDKQKWLAKTNEFYKFKDQVDQVQGILNENVAKLLEHSSQTSSELFQRAEDMQRNMPVFEEQSPRLSNKHQWRKIMVIMGVVGVVILIVVVIFCSIRKYWLTVI
jgi:Synaptobrevin